MKKTALLLFLALGTLAMNSKETGITKATFAGGCFWCMEAVFEKSDGVIEVISGYMGGTSKNPTYTDYANSGHIETIQVSYDPNVISYKQLLDLFWHQIDPTDASGQFVDRGKQYRSAIFYHNEQQKNDAQESKEKLATSKRFAKPIVTEILPVGTFYPAESYHQNYYKKNPLRYWWYRSRSGRDAFLNKAWRQKPSDAELRKKLTPEQYRITQKNGTERAFTNAYWDNDAPGIYVDVVSGEPLFSSKHKYKSGTGWPTFSDVLEPDNIVLKKDRGWLYTRTEVRSKHADSHLGHLFDDGPPPTRLRYCMNSAALRFVPVADLQREGYEKYIKLFSPAP